MSPVQGLSHEEIVGGQLTEPKTQTYNVHIRIGSTGRCSGAIIDEQFVVTAAHCLYDENEKLTSSNVKVIAGTTDVLDVNFPHRVEIEAVQVCLPGFREEVNFITKKMSFTIKDIVVLKLKTPLNLYNNEYISKVQLPEGASKDNTTIVDKMALVSGFGLSQIKPMELFDGRLRHLVANVIDKRDCFSGLVFFMRWLKNREDFICAKMRKDSSNPGGSTCMGDSGGPLVNSEGTLIGILSLGSPTCNMAESLFTKISHFREFIDKVIDNRPEGSMHCEVLGSPQ